MSKIRCIIYCKSCKHFENMGYSEEFGKEVTTCEMGRYREHAHAEKNNWLTECDYWESS